MRAETGIKHQQQSHDCDMFINRSLRLVTAHDVPGLLSSHRVGQERNIVS